MNRVKTLLAAGFVLALAFTFGCSDDKDDEKKKEPEYTWCEINTGGFITCIELNYAEGSFTYDKAYCEAIGSLNTFKESKPENCGDCRGSASSCPQ